MASFRYQTDTGDEDSCGELMVDEAILEGAPFLPSKKPAKARRFSLNIFARRNTPKKAAYRCQKNVQRAANLSSTRSLPIIATEVEATQPVPKLVVTNNQQEDPSVDTNLTNGWSSDEQCGVAKAKPAEGAPPEKENEGMAETTDLKECHTMEPLLLTKSHSAPELRHGAYQYLEGSWSDPSLCDEEDAVYEEWYEDWEPWGGYDDAMLLENGDSEQVSRGNHFVERDNHSASPFDEDEERSRVRKQATDHDLVGENEELLLAYTYDGDDDMLMDDLEGSLRSSCRVLTPIVEADSSPSGTEDESTTAIPFYRPSSDESLSLIELLSVSDEEDETLPAHEENVVDSGSIGRAYGDWQEGDTERVHPPRHGELDQSFESHPGTVKSEPTYASEFQIQSVPGFDANVPGIASDTCNYVSHFTKDPSISRTSMDSPPPKHVEVWRHVDELRADTASATETTYSEHYEDSCSSTYIDCSLDGSVARLPDDGKLSTRSEGMDLSHCQSPRDIDRKVVLAPKEMLGTPVRRKNISIVSPETCDGSVASICAEKRKERDAKAKELHSSLQEMQRHLREGSGHLYGDQNGEKEQKMLLCLFSICLVCFFAVLRLAPLFVRFG